MLSEEPSQGAARGRRLFEKLTAFCLEHGYCTSLYVTDPNGMIVELTVDAPNADRIAPDRRNDAHSELKRWLAGDHRNEIISTGSGNYIQ